MLFVYSALVLGGIETFFLRMAKERHSKGLQTSILLLYPRSKSNAELLSQMNNYAKIVFADELFRGPAVIGRIFPLIAPIRKKGLSNLLDQVDQIHGFIGKHVLLGYRLSRLSKKRLAVTVGFYHYLRYTWDANYLAYHERKNRDFVFNYLNPESLLFFSEDTKTYSEQRIGKKLPGAQTFRLGVVDKKDIKITGQIRKPLKVVSIGRIVEFKTYNFYMLDVVQTLLSIGHEVEFNIFGYGELAEQLQQEIEKRNLTANVHLRGRIEYSKFDEEVSKHDIFIGSGTAIIQAASLGVPSIVGIENLMEPVTYGYFCDVHNREYNLKGLNIPTYKVVDLLSEYILMSVEERKVLRQKHLVSIGEFTNAHCEVKFSSMGNCLLPVREYRYSALLYELSWIVDMGSAYFNPKHPFRLRHEKF